MAILIIGNGFDLAHNLKTKYSDFLDFIKAYIENDSKSEFYPFISEIKSNIELNKEIEHLTESNVLLYHFLSIYESRCKEGKEGWIDFESEISYLVQKLDEAKNEINSKIGIPDGSARLSRSLLSCLEPIIVKKGQSATDLYGHFFDTSFFDFQAKRVLDSLNHVTRLLEIYLHECIDIKKCDYRIQDLDGLDIDHVLSFNYTNTYRKYYDNKENTEYCYIHGKAYDDTTEFCNLVLGIDEYLPPNRIDDDNEFVWFKKFYQRIYKENDSEYIDWIKDISLINKMSTNIEINNDIYIYGHSLDITDKDVLSKLILMENTTTHIFYHNREAMAKEITNLIKIIGEANLIKMTGGKDRKIKFIQSKSAIKID